ncbi:MAG: hypothetical protein V4683_07730 [Bacteroidota bacterium]
MKLFTKYAIVLMICISSVAMAQMPHDAIYMPKKAFCFALSANQSEWTEYWENKLKRENLNIGKLTTQSAMVMVAAGITDNLNLIVGLPYVKTKTSAGNLMGQKGIQDLSGWLKYKMLDKSGLTIHGVLGASVPLGNYVPDFLPMSIGLQAKTVSGRVIGNYHHKSGVYLQAHASYIYRSTITIDKDSYLSNNKVYNTNVVAIPNATDTRAAVGYYKKGVQFEVFAESFTCVGGDNIRRNDMPFPTNAMNSKMIGAYAKYQPKNWGLNAKIGNCYEGQNVGNSTIYSVGILYQIKSKNQVFK